MTVCPGKISRIPHSPLAFLRGSEDLIFFKKYMTHMSLVP